jgi:hypothetical protein
MLKLWSTIHLACKEITNNCVDELITRKIMSVLNLITNLAPLSQSASELYWLSHRSMSAKLLPNFADSGCHVVSATDPHVCILGFLDRSHYCFFQVAPQLYSRGWMGSFSDPLLLKNLLAPGIKAGTSGSVTRNSDHKTTEAVITNQNYF